MPAGFYVEGGPELVEHRPGRVDSSAVVEGHTGIRALLAVYVVFLESNSDATEGLCNGPPSRCRIRDPC